jgi:(heptosyl)LPS beta-1,4-glucosyltransferase
MSTISVVLITKNEEDNLERCLESVKWADEIILLDSGSEDRTLEIAESFSAKVFTNTDWPGFGRQRQIAQSHASCDWVFMIDADEQVTPELEDEIKNVVKENILGTVYAVPRLTWAFGRFIRHSGWYPGYVVRLYQRKEANYNDVAVHEKVVFSKEIKEDKLNSDLLHFTYKTLNQYMKKSTLYAFNMADESLKLGKKGSLIKAISHGAWSFFKMYILKKGFLDGKQGLLLAFLGAQYSFLKYADLWVKQNNKPVN